MAITPRELFEERIPRGLDADPERVKDFGLHLQFDVTGSEGGKWVVDTTVEPPRCYAGTSPDPQCTIILSDEALAELLATPPMGRPQIVMKLIIEGGIEMEGDVAQAMKISKIFSVAES